VLAVDNAKQQLQQQSERSSYAASAERENEKEGLTPFHAIITPLEELAGKPLGGAGRGLCAAACSENRDGFGRLVNDLLVRDGVRSPLGLLVRMVRDGDHRLPAPEEQSSPESCPSCGYGGDRPHLADCKHATVRLVA
jgi:hypothetical protein